MKLPPLAGECIPGRLLRTYEMASRMKGSFRISGTILTHDGTPAKEAHISVWCPRVSITHECDAQGRFEIFLAERGTVTLSIRHAEHAEWREEVEVGTHGLECVLAKASKVSGTLTGFAPDDCEVLLIGTLAGGREILHAWPRHPHLPGSFSFDQLAVGLYEVELNAEWPNSPDH